MEWDKYILEMKLFYECDLKCNYLILQNFFQSNIILEYNLFI